MSEASCHYQHRNFSSGQQCIHCSYQEPSREEFKRDIKHKLEELLNCFKFFSNSVQVSPNAIIQSSKPLFHIYLTEEKLAELKQIIWYDYDIPDLLDEIIRELNQI